MLLMRRELMTPLVLNYRMQMSSTFCLKFFHLLQPSLRDLRVSHLLMICLRKPGTQSLVVNFPARWLLVVTMDTRLSGWDGIGKSIALCWLITDFPSEQKALIDAWSCGFGLSILPVPSVIDALATPQKQFLYWVHASCCPEWVQDTLQCARRLGQIWLSNVRACSLCTAPPLSWPLDGAVNSCL